MTPLQIRAAAVKIARDRAEGFHTGECERGHTEWDTNAFVCSNRNGCLCVEREEEAEAIADKIAAIPIDHDPVNAAAEDMAKALEGIARMAKNNLGRSGASAIWLVLPAVEDQALSVLARYRAAHPASPERTGKEQTNG